MVDFLFNPWVITVVVVCVIVGNLAALKHTADLQMRLRSKKSDLDKLNALDKLNPLDKPSTPSDREKNQSHHH